MPCFGKAMPSKKDPVESYRRDVDKLRKETIAEIGPQPMDFNRFAFAITIASFFAILALQAIKIVPELDIGEFLIALFFIFIAAVIYQRIRYDRFYDVLNKKIEKMNEMEATHWADND
jgi:hypothetical protein